MIESRGNMEKGCPSCGRMIDAELNKCPYCNYDFTELNKMFNQYEEQKEIHVPKYAGFIRRTVANGFDYFVWTLVFLIITGVYAYFRMPELFAEFSFPTIIDTFSNKPEKIIELCIPFFFMPIVYFFYCVFTQSSKKMGTWGQRIVGIEVADEDDVPIGFKQSFVRNIARLLNVVTLGIGYLMIIFTKRKQSLSDIVSKTCVTNHVTDEKYNDFQYAGGFTRFLAFVIDLVFLLLIFICMLFVLTFVAKYQLPNSDIILLIIKITFVLIIVLYFPYLESTRGLTLGKKMFGLKVQNLYGENISFFKSILRIICLVIECFVSMGAFLCFVTPRKQTFKDVMTKTVVINKNAVVNNSFLGSSGSNIIGHLFLFVLALLSWFFCKIAILKFALAVVFLLIAVRSSKNEGKTIFLVLTMVVTLLQIIAFLILVLGGYMVSTVYHF